MNPLRWLGIAWAEIEYLLQEAETIFPIQFFGAWLRSRHFLDLLLGIPAIVGIPNITRILKDHERVRMDGASGIIERLDAEVASEPENNTNDGPSDALESGNDVQ